MAATITKLPTAAAEVVVNPAVLNPRTRGGRKPKGVICFSTARWNAQLKRLAAERFDRDAEDADRVALQLRTRIALDVTDLSPDEQSRVQGFADGLRAMRQGV